MNTVEALNVLGKALCGDSFEVKPGLTDAETILEIAKNYTGGGSGGGGGSAPSIPVITAEWDDDNGNYRITSHTYEELESIYLDYHETFIFNFIGQQEDMSGKFWTLTDADFVGSTSETHRLYFGTGEIAVKPTLDRENAFDVIRTHTIIVPKDTIDATGHPTCTLGSNDWNEPEYK